MNFIITEQQAKILAESTQATILCESLRDIRDFESFKKEIARLVRTGIAVGVIISAVNSLNLTPQQKEETHDVIKKEIVNKKKAGDWKLACSSVIATVYNAVPSQCNKDCGHTASGFRLNLNNVASHRIIAMERTFMSRLGLKYGDVVKIEGTGQYDGVWQIQDTMNKRFAGTNKIDILVPKNIRFGQWDNVKLYVLNKAEDTAKYRRDMAPQLSKEAFAKQQANT